MINNMDMKSKIWYEKKRKGKHKNMKKRRKTMRLLIVVKKRDV